MGREAKCLCTWAEKTALCSVLLESRELIVRGPIRHRVPLSSLTELAVQKDLLRFRVGQDQISLALGPEVAARWVKAIATPPSSLAEKLGITSSSYVLLVGKAEAEELKEALAQAETTNSRRPNLIVICAGTGSELTSALDRCSTYPDAAIWVIYRKGQKIFGETVIRGTLLARGWVDTKIAAVSAVFTGLRFTKRKRSDA